MHELTIAKAIVEMALEETEKCKAGSVMEIELEVGVLSGVDQDALVFALSLAVKDTILEKSAVKVLSPGGLGRCTACNLTFEMMEVWTPCPGCNMPAGEIAGGEQLRFVSLVVGD